jgi:hypothetical protein
LGWCQECKTPTKRNDRDASPSKATSWRTALVQCSLIAKQFSPYLQKFYQPIQRRRGGGKANIALARKLLGVIYHTLKNNWVF